MSLRLPLDVHAEVQAAAALAGRSMNDEIVHRLQAFAHAATLNDIAQQTAEVKRMVQQLIDKD